MINYAYHDQYNINQTCAIKLVNHTRKLIHVAMHNRKPALYTQLCNNYKLVRIDALAVIIMLTVHVYLFLCNSL